MRSSVALVLLAPLFIVAPASAQPATSAQEEGEPWTPPEESAEGEQKGKPRPAAKRRKVKTRPQRPQEPIEGVETGSRVRMEAFDSPADVAVVGRNRLEKPGAKSFREAATSVAGVRANARGENPTLAGFELRGLGTHATSGGNVLILLDGIPQRRMTFGGPYLGALPTDAVNRMEIVKGPLSAQYGRGSLAGALQLFTDPPDEALGARVRAMHEFVTNTQRASLQISGPFPSRHASFALTSSGTIARGWQPRTAGNRADMYLHMHATPSWREEVKLLVGAVRLNENLPAPVLIDREGSRLAGIPRDANLAVPEQNNLELTELRAGAHYTYHWSDSFNTKAIVSYWHGATDWRVGQPVDAPASGTVVERPSHVHDWMEHGWFMELSSLAGYRFEDTLVGALTLGVSGEGMLWDSSMRQLATNRTSFDEGIPVDRATLDEPPSSSWIRSNWATRETGETNWGIFVGDTTTFHELITVQAAVRYDGYRRSQENLNSEALSSASDGVVSPFAGAVVHAYGSAHDDLGMNVYGNWGRGFNPVFGAMQNADIVELEPETSESFEVGLKTQAFRSKLEVVASLNQLARNDVVRWDARTQQLRNSGDWMIRGVEMTLRARPYTGLTMYGWAAFRNPYVERDALDTEFVGNDIPFVAVAMAAFGASYRPAKGLGGSLEGRYVGRTYADAANNIELPEYVLLDADLSYRLRELTASFFAKNLTDADYYSAVLQGVRNGSAYVGTPRTFGVEVSLQY